MRKYILLFAILFASCDTQVEETKGFGFWLGDENETFVNLSKVIIPSGFGYLIFLDFVFSNNERWSGSE